MFPYYANYGELVGLEVSSVKLTLGAGVGREELVEMEKGPLKVMLVGCGALPLSAVWWKKLGGGEGREVEVRNVDCDGEAVKLAEEVCNVLQVESMSFEKRRVGQEDDVVGEGRYYAGVEVLVLAALVGETQAEKERILLVSPISIPFQV